MGSTVDAALWAVAAMLGAAALWMSRPRPPAFDPARIWLLTLSTLVRGDMERAGRDVAAWEKEVARITPAGLPGDPLADPALLGEAHDPALLVGAACTWDALAEGRAEAWAAVARRLASVRFVALGPWPLALPGVELLRLDGADEAAIESVLDGPQTRVVLCASGDADPLLRWLADSPGLRDRTRALLLLAPRVGIALGHPAFDTELERETPWLVLREKGGPRLETPPDPPTHRRSIRIVDLGELELSRLDPERHGRALLLLLAALG